MAEDPLSPEDIFHLVASIDGGGDRTTIDKEEFAACSMGERIKFAKLDTNKDGVVSMEASRVQNFSFEPLLQKGTTLDPFGHLRNGLRISKR